MTAAKRLEGFGGVGTGLTENPPNAGGLDEFTGSSADFAGPVVAAGVLEAAADEPNEKLVKGDAGLGGAAGGAEKENPPNADTGLGAAAAGVVVDVDTPPKLKAGAAEVAVGAEEFEGAPKLAKGFGAVDD